MTTLNDERALSVLLDYVFANKDKIGGEISFVKDKNGVLDFVLKNEIKAEQDESQAVKIDINALADTIKDDFGKYGYNRRFDRTATVKKIKTALNSKDKSKRLLPFEIAYAFKCYLLDCHLDGCESTFVKLASSFMTNLVYDYADRPKAKEMLERKMVEKYGQNWRKVKFIYV